MQFRNEESPRPRTAWGYPHHTKPPSAAQDALPARVGGEYSITLVPVRVYRNTKEYASGFKWNVVFDGKALLKASRNPEFDACRALVKLGLTGKLTTYREDGRPCMTLNIEKAAKMTVSETRAHGPRFVPYKPFPDDWMASDSNAIGHFEPGKEASGVQTAVNGEGGLNASYGCAR